MSFGICAILIFLLVFFDRILSRVQAVVLEHDYVAAIRALEEAVDGLDRVEWYEESDASKGVPIATSLAKVEYVWGSNPAAAVEIEEARRLLRMKGPVTTTVTLS